MLTDEMENEVNYIEDALVHLLREITRHDKGVRRKTREPGEFRFLKVSEVLSKSRLYWDARRLRTDPVREACAQAVRKLGQRLHERGADMMAVHDRVILRTPRHRNYWSVIIDKNWDGIADWWA